jgi:hypothetical protein
MDSRGILSQSQTWIASQRASLAATLAQLASVPGSTANQPDRHGEGVSRQLTLFDHVGSSSKTVRESNPTDKPSGEPCAIEDTIPEMAHLMPPMSARPTSDGAGLCSQLGPTLTAANSHGNAQPRVPKTKRAETLPHLVRRLLPTLCATDHKSPYSLEGYQKQAAIRSKPLRDTAAHTIGIRLTPDFCEWWMGWPIGASASLHSETHGCPSKRRSRGACSAGQSDDREE